MTVANQTRRISAVGNAAIGQEVPFSFPYAATSDIKVYSRVTATGVETLLAETTNYTLTAPSDTGGTLTTVTAVAATSEIHIIRDTPKTQSLDLEQGGSFNAEDVEDALDKNTKLIIENNDSLNRALRAPATDAATLDLEIPNSVERASKVLSFDSDGNATASVAVPTGSVSFTTFGTDMAETANATSARTLLELGWFDIRAYGAGTGESAATNATAIQAAITAAQAVGGTVFGPPGEYLIDTALDVTNSITIWMPGVTIKQDDGADQTYVLKIDVASSKDVSLFIKVDGNMDNNTAIEGIVINGPRLSHGQINVTATECDTGIIVEGNTESNVMFLKGINCGIGVLERAEGGNTPDENTLFISGHANVTHYKKESADIQITSTLHFSCETTSGYAVILDGGETILNGILRGCNAGGVQVTHDQDVASIFLLFNNLRVMSGGDVGWGLIVDESDFINGSISTENFAGGVWIKKCSRGRLRIEARSSATLPAIRLGESGVSSASRFTVLPGSYAFATTGPALHLAQTSYCDINLLQLNAGSGDEIEFETTAANDTIRVIGRDAISIENNSTYDYTIEYYGQGISALADEATPSIQGSNLWKTGGTTGITDFDDGFTGQVITVLCKHSLTFDFTTAQDADHNLDGSSADITVDTGDVLKFLCEDGTKWQLISNNDASADNN